MFKFPNTPGASVRAITRIPVDAVCTGPFQARRQFSPEAAEALAASIRRHGLLSPLLVRRMPEGGFELVAGERRLRALRAIGRSHAEAIVVSGDDAECAMMALAENLQREPLHFLDEAGACGRILSGCPVSRDKLAAALGRSPVSLACRLRLLKLSPRTREIIRRSGLTERHARVLLRQEDPGEQAALARQAAEQRLSAARLEARLAQRLPAARARVSPLIRDNRIVINALMDTVRELGRIGVRVSSRVEEKGDHVEVIVCIPACGEPRDTAGGETGKNSAD